VLQCVAVCCSVLQCVAVCCSVLQCVAVCCSVLQCVAVCCSVHITHMTYDMHSSRDRLLSLHISPPFVLLLNTADKRGKNSNCGADALADSLFPAHPFYLA